ncbi:MAG: nucleotide pyrophosphohydrolase [Betaproteobacteria bacterium]|nr:nucleotide pyrophosphohydrolase [Betaproteobacteria bacterium]
MIDRQLLDELLAFRSERDWRQFHNPRTLAASISIEAAELLEHFQWAKDAELPDVVAKNREAIEHEIADVAMYLSLLCHDIGVSLEDAVGRKLALNRMKYPVDRARGRSTKHDRLD